MLTTVKSPSPHTDSLSNLNGIRSNSPSKSSLSSNASDMLLGTVERKRRSEKRVRFALKLEPVEEASLPSSREISPTMISKSNRRVVDPWRENGPLFGAYIEYLEKQDALATNEVENRRIPPPPPPPAPEPGAEPPTYTHTFVIQTKSPEILIDSITVSTPPLHLPRILYRTQKTNKQQLPLLDSYLKQQLTLSTNPRMMHTKKITNSPNQKLHSTPPLVQPTLKRTEYNMPSINGIHLNNRMTRSENSLVPKYITEHVQSKKLTEVISRPLPGTNNQINHFSEGTMLPNSSKRQRTPSRTTRTKDDLNTNTPYCIQTRNNDGLVHTTINSNY